MSAPRPSRRAAPAPRACGFRRFRAAALTAVLGCAAQAVVAAPVTLDFSSFPDHQINILSGGVDPVPGTPPGISMYYFNYVYNENPYQHVRIFTEVLDSSFRLEADPGRTFDALTVRAAGASNLRRNPDYPLTTPPPDYCPTPYHCGGYPPESLIVLPLPAARISGVDATGATREIILSVPRDDGPLHLGLEGLVSLTIKTARGLMYDRLRQDDYCDDNLLGGDNPWDPRTPGSVDCIMPYHNGDYTDMWFDDLVIEVHGGAPAPVPLPPALAPMAAVALAGLALARRFSRRGT